MLWEGELLERERERKQTNLGRRRRGGVWMDGDESGWWW
jgi:hypothetical protein